MEKANWKIQWTSKSIYVDLHTGEIITKEKAKRNYEQIRITKKTQLNANRTKGFIEYTIECRFRPKLSEEW